MSYPLYCNDCGTEGSEDDLIEEGGRCAHDWCNGIILSDASFPPPKAHRRHIFDNPPLDPAKKNERATMTTTETDTLEDSLSDAIGELKAADETLLTHRRETVNAMRAISDGLVVLEDYGLSRDDIANVIDGLNATLKACNREIPEQGRVETVALTFEVTVHVHDVFVTAEVRGDADDLLAAAESDLGVTDIGYELNNAVGNVMMVDSVIFTDGEIAR